MSTRLLSILMAVVLLFGTTFLVATASTGPAELVSAKTEDRTKQFDIVSDSGFALPGLSAALNEQAQLNVQRIYRSQDGLQLDASWGYLPGKHPYNAAIDEAVEGLLHSYAANKGWRYAPAAQGLPDFALIQAGEQRTCGDELSVQQAVQRSQELEIPVLHIGCEVLFAQGSQLGQRIIATEFLQGESIGIRMQDFFVDTDPKFSSAETLRVGNAAAFFEEPVEQLGEAIMKLARSERWQFSEDAEAGFYDEMLRGLLLAHFNTDGHLLIPRMGQTPLQNDQLLLVTGFSTASVRDYFLVDGGWVREHLSDWGRDVQNAARENSPYTGPTNVPAGRDHVNCSLVPCLAVTYDDGPWSSTPDIVRVLAKYDQAATFYVLGHLLENGGWIVKETHDAGHEIGNHSWNHPNLNRLKESDIRWQLEATNRAIAAITGERPSSYRPPYGAWSNQLRQISGMIGVLWNVDSYDWRNHPDNHYRDLVNRVKAGDIVLFHDVQAQTARLAEEIIADYTARGFQLVTISQLFAGTGVSPGAMVYHR